MKERANKRWARRVQVQFWEKGERAKVGYTVNVSATGMFVATSSPCAKGSRITLKVMLPDRSFELEADVKHAVRSSPLLQKVRQSGMGVLFVRRQPRIRELLANEATDGLEPLEKSAGEEAVEESADEEVVDEAEAEAPEHAETDIEVPELASLEAAEDPGAEVEEPAGDRKEGSEDTESGAQPTDDDSAEQEFRLLRRELDRAREALHLREEELRHRQLATGSREEELTERIEELERLLEESDGARRRISRHLLAMTDGQDSLRSRADGAESVRTELERRLAEARRQIESVAGELDEARGEIARLREEREAPDIPEPDLAREELEKPIQLTAPPPPRLRPLAFAALLLAGIAIGIPLGIRLGGSGDANDTREEAAATTQSPAPRPGDRGTEPIASATSPDPALEAAAAEPETSPPVGAPAPKVAQVTDETVDPASPPAPEPESEPEAPAVEAAVRAWASAWSDQRVDDYLAFYSDRFQPAGGLGRSDWEAQRRDRLLRPQSIKVTLAEVTVTHLAPDLALLTFRQTYDADSYRDQVTKTLELALEDGRWQIITEESDG
jgi:hypothetical protein